LVIASTMVLMRLRGIRHGDILPESWKSIIVWRYFGRLRVRVQSCPFPRFPVIHR
jgi:hypothetical protein